MALKLLWLPRDERLLWPAERAEIAEASVAFHLEPEHPSFAWAVVLNPAVKPLEGNAAEPGAHLLGAMSSLDELRRLVDRLLGPGGCPWDQKQTHESLKPYLLEESYELLDAIDREDRAAIREELGDVLLQPILHAQISGRGGGFDTDRVAQGITDKLIRRHPHVFGEVSAETPEQVLQNWDAIKRSEKGELRSVLDGIPAAMPALLRAHEVSKRAARAGFEWPDLDGVWAKLDEEIAELKAAAPAEQASELGDILFTVVNLARWMKVEPEDALRQMVNRFTSRFQTMESASDQPLNELSPERWDTLWNEAKSATL